MEPRVQYANAADGVRIAFTVSGSGPPLVYLQPHSHVQREWELPEMREWYTRLASHHRLVRLDIRHFGLSQRDAGPITVDTCVADVEAVVGALGLERFDLMGVSGLSAAAVAYAVRHPEQVAKLALWAATANGATDFAFPRSRSQATRLISDVDPDLAIEVHSRFLFGERPLPRDDQREFTAAAMRVEGLAAYAKYFTEMDVSGILAHIQSPTLVVYPRRGEYLPIDAAQRNAAAIPSCQFVDCDAEMYPFLGPDQDHNLRVVEGFLNPGAEVRWVESPSTPGTLTAREVEVLTSLARGRTNQEIAASLGLSGSTVDRHVANIYTKARVHNRAEATLWAVSHGIVKPEPST